MIAGLAKAGMTMVVVEQNVAEALELAGRAYVLALGRITRSGGGRDLLADEGIRKAYLGH